MTEKQGFVYIMASGRNGTLYIWVTSSLIRRVYEHKNGFTEGFTKRYNCKMLAYYESCDFLSSALEREKQIKWWNRKRKLFLIEQINPQWKDLYEGLLG